MWLKSQRECDDEIDFCLWACSQEKGYIISTEGHSLNHTKRVFLVFVNNRNLNKLICDLGFRFPQNMMHLSIVQNRFWLCVDVYLPRTRIGHSCNMMALTAYSVRFSMFFWTVLLSRRLFWGVGQVLRSLLIKDLNDSLERLLHRAWQHRSGFSLVFV